MGDHHDFGVAGALGFELHDRLDRYPRFPEAGADLADHTRLVAGAQPHVVAMFGDGAVHQAAGAPAAGRQQRIEGGLAATAHLVAQLVAHLVDHLADAGDVEDVGHDGRCRRPGPGSRPVKHHFTDRIPFHQDCVVDSIHPGQGMGLGQQGGMDSHIEQLLGLPTATGHSHSIRHSLGDCQQLHHKAQLGRIGHIAGVELVDALGGDGVPGHAAAVGQAGQDGDLVGRISPLHISCGIGFRVAQPLGIGQHVGVGRSLGRHAAENVVGGAIDDAADPLDAVCSKGLLERFDDWNAPAHGGLDQHIHAMGGGGRGDLLAVTGDHRLVCGHHRLAGSDCLQDQGAGRLQAAHHLHHDLDGRVFDHCPGISGQQVARQRHWPRTGQVAHSHPAQGQLCHQRMAPLRARQDGRHACPHRAEPEQADADGHALGDCGTAILEIRCIGGVKPRC